MTRRAIITGITGQDGSYLAELLLDKGYEVFGAVRRLSAPNHWRLEHLLDRVELRPADLLDQLSLIRLVDDVRPHEIYNLAAMANHRGIVLVTQDVATITDFEQIIVLDDGNLVGDGRHEELLAHCPTYARLWEIEEKLMEVAGGTAA